MVSVLCLSTELHRACQKVRCKANLQRYQSRILLAPGKTRLETHKPNGHRTPSHIAVPLRHWKKEDARKCDHASKHRNLRRSGRLCHELELTMPHTQFEAVKSSSMNVARRSRNALPADVVE